ncbi:hypothetical protein A8C32_00175 [Flavivirga aquatica]|uniref:Uncharacterized protein n=1 Tax=Flavivirga aquatica TaxID=1849968 RepID=A0A1E5TBI8_9FLAO|nr:hypothetical protein [Flavivirga aquatica]OEK08732.1 hypothetical protein A8C32_00175 [Flavivirga aquatica]
MKVLKLDLNKKEYVNDSLSLLLTRFSHKPSPEIGQAERGTAHLSLFQDNNYYEIMLSEHGISGIPRTKDGLSEMERYDSIIWKEYIIQLKKISYDKSIEVTLSKKDN